MVPEGWTQNTLSEIVKEKISYGIVQAGPHIDDGVPYIKSSDVRGGITPSQLQKTSNDIHHKYRRSAVHPGDIVFSLRGNIGEAAIVPNELKEANLTQGTARISVSNEHNNLFHYYQLTSTSVLNHVNALSKGSTFKEISLEELRKVKVHCPPLAEQKKIAQILSTWDQAIATTERLLDLAHQQKKALMQQLLTGKKRFPGFEGEWKTKNLGDVCQPQQWATISSTDLVEDGYPVYGANGFIGFFSAFNHEYETVAVTCRGSTCGEVSLIPAKSYITGNSMCLDDIDPAANSYRFVYQLLRLRGFNDVISGSAQPQIVGKAIRKIKLHLPRIDEQIKIASVLSAADQEIETLQSQLDGLKQEKKALMQALLTGKRRVSVDE